jgi:hypothetical protein
MAAEWQQGSGPDARDQGYGKTLREAILAGCADKNVLEAKEEGSWPTRCSTNPA